MKYTYSLLLLQTLAEKKEKYEILKEKLCLMETQFTRFQVWLEKVEGSLNKCKSLTAAVDQKQFQKVKVSGKIKYYISMSLAMTFSGCQSRYGKPQTKL